VRRAFPRRNLLPGRSRVPLCPAWVLLTLGAADGSRGHDSRVTLYAVFGIHLCEQVVRSIPKRLLTHPLGLGDGVRYNLREPRASEPVADGGKPRNLVDRRTQPSRSIRLPDGEMGQ